VDGSALHGVTENLSAGGLLVRTDRELPKGARVPLLVGFPGLLPPTELEVEVVRARPASAEEPAALAVRIPDDRPGDRARLARLAAAAAEPAPADGHAFRLLVVEDNALVEAAYDHALKLLAAPGRGIAISVEHARDGLQALARLEQPPAIDLLVTDLFMPELDGFQLVERLRRMPALERLPVMAISGGDEVARGRALQAGVDVYLRKPVRVQDVLGTVRALLRIR
jgi:CheY-like chemotaxis protein